MKVNFKFGPNLARVFGCSLRAESKVKRRWRQRAALRSGVTGLRLQDRRLEPEELVSEIAAHSGFFVDGAEQVMTSLVSEATDELRTQYAETRKC
jgi:hypothetical protein